MCQDCTPRLIPLTKDQFAIVDGCDYEELSKFKWHANWNFKTQSYYAVRNQNLAPDGEPWIQSKVKMHRQILGLKRGDRLKGDHRDGNTLNNRRYNLRPVNDSQSAINRKLTKANTSGHKGVRQNKGETRWRASIKINGRSSFLGSFVNKEDAITARSKAEIEYFGDYRRMEERGGTGPAPPLQV